MSNYSQKAVMVIGDNALYYYKKVRKILNNS